MKVLVNGLQIGKNNSGVQYYTKHLHNAIQKIQLNNVEIELYSITTKPHSPLPIPHTLSFQTFVFRFLYPFRGRIYRISMENFLLPRYLKRNGFSSFHSPNYVLPFFLRFPSVITVHDLITFDFPKLCQWESVLYFKLFLPHSIRKSDRIIAVSETTKRDIVKRFKVPESKIDVIHLGISSIFKRTIDQDILLKHNIIGKYILFVGNIEPKKNLVRLIQAYHNLHSSGKISQKLVIAGKNGWKYKKVYKTVEKLELQNQVIFTGYIPEKDLPALYSKASLFVFPSIYEGFGIPPLEAMACEVPVLASDKGALPETTGGNALLVDPYSIEIIAEGIYQLLTVESLRQQYIAQGKKWVKNFTWEKAAKQTIEVYQQALAEVKYDLSS